jgi:hypothetical protein
MALDIQTITIDTLGANNITRDVIIVDGTGDNAEILVKTGMPENDLATLTAVATLGVGSTLKDKMQSYVLPNGKTAWDVFGGSVKTMAKLKASYSSVYTKAACASKIAASNAAIQGAIVDLDAITVADSLADAQVSAEAALDALAAVA